MRKPIPWYVILLFGIALGYLLGLVHQAAQKQHRQNCETCRSYYLQETGR